MLGPIAVPIYFEKIPDYVLFWVIVFKTILENPSIVPVSNTIICIYSFILIGLMRDTSLLVKLSINPEAIDKSVYFIKFTTWGLINVFPN